MILIEYIDVDLLNEEKLLLQKECTENAAELRQVRPIADFVKKLEMDLALTEKVNNSNVDLSKSNISLSNLLWTKLPSLSSILPNLQAHLQNLLEQVINTISFLFLIP